MRRCPQEEPARRHRHGDHRIDTRPNLAQLEHLNTAFPQMHGAYGHGTCPNTAFAVPTKPNGPTLPQAPGLRVYILGHTGHPIAHIHRLGHRVGHAYDSGSLLHSPIPFSFILNTWYVILRPWFLMPNVISHLNAYYFIVRPTTVRF